EHLKLIEKTRSPQGVPVRKVIVFNRRKAEVPQPQVTDFLLLDDATGQMICSAHIVRRQIVANRGEIPREMELRWPEQKLKLVMTIMAPETSGRIPSELSFRPRLKVVPGYARAAGGVEGVKQAAPRRAGYQQ